MMELKTFYDEFELMAEAPNGIQKLREMILQLAVQGKLVAQDPNDEPASVLLEKIKAEKERLIKKGLIKRVKSLPAVTEKELAYKAPSGWEWIRMGEVVELISGQHIKASNYNEVGEGISYLTGPSDFGPLHPIVSKWTEKPKTTAVKDDILLTVKGAGLGKNNIVDIEKVAISRQLMAIRCICINNRFIHLLIKSKYQYFQSIGLGIAIPGISRNNVLKMPFSLPPVNEQKRIVAKADELMALCDDLEARKQKAYQTCIKLNDSSINQLLTAPTPKKFNKHWNRIHRNFDLLYSKPENVTKLRQAILQLAVKGKLVPQNPNDEPASVLLKKIKIELEQLVAEGKIKKTKPLPPIDEANAPYTLPKGWVWARFPELGEFARGKSKHRPRNAPELYKGGTIPLVQTGDVARSNGIITTHTGLYNENGLAQSKLWKKGTMCITIAANIADSGILGMDACFPDSVVGFVVSKEIRNARYFEFFHADS